MFLYVAVPSIWAVVYCQPFWIHAPLLENRENVEDFFSHVTLNAVAVFYQIDAEKLIRNCISGAAQRSHSLSEIPQSVPTPSTFTMDQGQEIILFRLQLT